MSLSQNYKKYRWFFTTNNKLVIGGKNAEQNDFIMGEIKKDKNDFVVMHTAHPGSPFSIILEDINKVKKEDIEECAIFTGAFSRAWKEGKKNTRVHIFGSKDVYKTKGMKEGTWGVRGKIKEIEVSLELALVKQNNLYKAVPLKNLQKEKILLKVIPGKEDKTLVVTKILKLIDEKKSKREELLSALPAGGIKICE